MIRKLYLGYIHLLSRSPLTVMVIVSAISVSSIVASLCLHPIPDFSDPQGGFETRGTEISDRMIAWENLVDSISHVGPLTTNPLELKKYKSEQRKRRKKKNFRKVKIGNNKDKSSRRSLRLRRSENKDAFPIVSKLWERHDIGWLCGDPLPDYARVVFESSRNESLFKRESIISMCSLDQTYLRSNEGFHEICERKGPAKCCPGWSLGGYIALLTNKTSCFRITDDDVSFVYALLETCAKYYHSGELLPNCLRSSPNRCTGVPESCTMYNAPYHIFHYLADLNSFSSKNKKSIGLKYAMSFLPVGRSSATLPYFREIIEKYPIDDGITRIAGMNLGVKEALFDEYMVQDGYLLLVGGILISLAVWSYTRSAFLTLVTLTGVVYSLGLAYSIYTFVLGIEFFPFVNVLAVVISLGVGVDDTFILVKLWSSFPKDNIDKRLRKTLNRSLLTIFVTSFTTSVAFLVSYISSITAIKCFSAFACIAISSNFLIMLTWTPASLAFRAKYLSGCGFKAGEQIPFLKILMDESSKIRNWIPLENGFSIFFEKILPYLIIRLRYAWIGIFGTLGALSLFVVFYYPGLRLPDQEEFQLFHREHYFERYNSEFRSQFGFELLNRRESSFKMPLTFVWGAKLIDNGDSLNPGSKGTLELDPNFDVASVEAQRWLLKFCVKLRRQSFYTAPLFGPPLLSNCFIETFKSWMERRCEDGLTNKNRFPCCRRSKFPYERSVFEKCLTKSVEDLYATPRDFWIPSVAGPKFNASNNRVAALIVEYDSNVIFSFSNEKIQNFYESVDTWFRNHALSSAPPELASGFFLSHLKFLDIQNALSQGTLASVIIATSVSGVILLVSTRSPILALLCALNVGSVIFVTLSVLVLSGWKLNILESVSVTLTIGLSMDFTLHYGVMYSSYEKTESLKGLIAKSLSRMAGPVSMAAFTTFCSGVTLLPARALPYVQIGTFIIIIMTVSWIYSTFFLQSLLRIYGPSKFLTCNFPIMSKTSEVVSRIELPEIPVPRVPTVSVSQPIRIVGYIKSEDTSIPKKNKVNHVHVDGTVTLPSPRNSIKNKRSSLKILTQTSKSLTKLCTAQVHSEGSSFAPKRPRDPFSKKKRKSRKRRRGSLPICFQHQSSTSFDELDIGVNGLPRPQSFCYFVNDDGEIESLKERRSRLRNVGKHLSPRDITRLLLRRHHHQSDSEFSKSEYNLSEKPYKEEFSVPNRDNEEDNCSISSWNFFRRHPSTTTVLFSNDSYDPKPILPNKTPGTPDVWLPRTILKA